MVKPQAGTRVFDLAISGAGISGLIAGIRCQQQGVRSVIIEKQKRFADVLRGEYIQPAGLKSLEGLGILSQIQKEGFPIFSVEHHFWPMTPFKKKKVIDFPYAENTEFPDHALAIPHLNLKEILLKIYLKKGGALWMDSVIEDFEILIGNDVRIFVKRGDDRSDLTAAHLAISEGVLSNLAKKLSFKWNADPSPTSFMVGGVTHGDHIPLGKFVTAQSSEGLICAFKLNSQDTRVYYYRDLPSRLSPFKQKKPVDFLKKAIKTCAISHLFKDSHLDDRIMAAPYVPRYTQTPSLGSVTLIGDAAGASHPLGGMGMSTATADGIRLADLCHDYLSDTLSLKEVNARFNKERTEKYLNNKFVSECLSFIIGGMNTKNRAVRTLALKIWSENPEARKFCGRIFGGTLVAPLDMSGLLNIWGITKDLSFIPWGQNVPKVHYALSELSPGKILSDMIK